MINYLYFIFSCIACCTSVQFNTNRVFEGYPVVITCTAFMVASTPETNNMTCVRLIKMQWYNRTERAYSLLAWHRYVPGKPYDSHIFVKRKNWMFKFSSHDIQETKCNNRDTIKLQLHIMEAEMGEAGEYQCQKVYVGLNDVFTKADNLYVIPYAGTTQLVKLVALFVAAVISGLLFLAICISCFCKCCQARRAQTPRKKKSKEQVSQGKIKKTSMLDRPISCTKVTSSIYDYKDTPI